MLLSEITCNSGGKIKRKHVISSLAWESVKKKFDATTTIPWEFVCYYDSGRKTKPITKSKHIVFDVKKYSSFIWKYTIPESY